MAGVDCSATAGSERAGEVDFGSLVSLTGSKLGRLPEFEGRLSWLFLR
jgi:hypothetical protein